MVDKARTLTPAENAVMEMLRDGPADLSKRTEIVSRRRLGSDVGHRVRLVESVAARRLEKAGLVIIEQGQAKLVNSDGAS